MQKRATKKNQNMLLNGITGTKINPKQVDSSQESKTIKMSLQGATQSGGITTKRSGSKKFVKDSNKALGSINGSNQVVSQERLERLPTMGQKVPVPGFINSESNWRYSRLNVPNSPTVKAENSNDVSQSNARMGDDMIMLSPHSRHGTENDTVFINSMDFNNQQNFLFSQGQQQQQPQSKYIHEQNGTCEVMLKQPSHQNLVNAEMNPPLMGYVEPKQMGFKPSKTGGWTPDQQFALSQRDLKQFGADKKGLTATGTHHITGFPKQGIFNRGDKKNLGLYGTQKQISDISAKLAKKRDLKIVKTSALKTDYNKNQEHVIKSARQSKTDVGSPFALNHNPTMGSVKAKKDLQALEESAQENESIINEIKVMQQLGASGNFHTSDDESVKHFESSIVQKWTQPKGSLMEQSKSPSGPSNSQMLSYQQRKLNEIKKGIADIKELTHLSSTQQSQQTFQDSKPVSPGDQSPRNGKDDIAQNTWSVMVTPALGRNLQNITQREKLGTAASKTRSHRYEAFTKRRRNKSQSGSHHVGVATLSTDGGFGFSDSIEQAERTLKENISKSQSKLTKNYGMVYNKIHWDHIHEQKKQFAETAINPTMVPVFKIRQMSSLKKERELLKAREQELQELDTQKFLKYLKRDEIVIDESEFAIMQNKEPQSPQIQPQLYTSQFKSYRAPLNKFGFRRETGPLLHTRTPRTNRYRQAIGMSNYEFALGQNDFGPLYEHSSLLQNNMEDLQDQMDIIDRHEEILNEQEQQNLTQTGGGFSVEVAQEKGSCHDANLRIQNLNYSCTTMPVKTGGGTGGNIRSKDQFPTFVQNIHQQNSTLADETKSNDNISDTRQQMPGCSAIQAFYDNSANSVSDKLQQQSQQFIISEFDTGQGQIRIENRSPSIFEKDIKEKQQQEEETPSKPAPKKAFSPPGRACRPGIKRSPTKKKISVAIPERQLSKMGTVLELSKLLDGGNKKPGPNQPKVMQRLLQKKKSMSKKEEFKTPLAAPPQMASTLDKEELAKLREAEIIKPLSSKQFKGVPIPKSFMEFDLARLQEVTDQTHETLPTSPIDESATQDVVSQCSELTTSEYVKPTPQMREMNKVVLMLEECFNTLQFQEIQKILNSTPKSPGLRGPGAGLSVVNKALTTQSLSKDIKIYQQDCQRMVTAIDDYPAIQIETPIDIQLTKGVKLYYRFQLKGLPSPLLFDIQYNDVPAEQSNMEMFLSTTHKTPNKEGHELRFLSKKQFYLQADKIGSTNTKNKELDAADKRPKDNLFLHPPGSNQVEEFTDKYLYICFDSTFLDLGITVTIKLIQSRQAKNKIKLRQYQQRREDTYQEAQNHFNPKEPYYRAMLDMVEQQRLLMVRYKEMIQREGFQKFYPDPERDQKKFILKRSREQLTKANKAILDIDHLKRKLFMMQKWDLLRGIKDEQFLQKRKIKRNIVYSTRYIQRIKAKFIINKVWQTFEEYKITKQRKLKSAFICFMYKIRYKRKLRKKGSTRDIRINRWCKNTITAAGPPLVATCEERALNILSKFLLEWSKTYKMQGIMYSFINRTYKIQERLNYKLHQKQQRKLSLKTQAWMKELAKITIYFNAIKQSDKQRVIWSKIAAITEEQKAFMVEIHYKRQLVDSHIRFMRWYIAEQEFKAEQDKSFMPSSKYKTYKKDLPHKIECLEYLEEFLEHSLEKYGWIQKIDEYLIQKREKEENKLKKQVTKKMSKKKSGLSTGKGGKNNSALKMANMLLDTTNDAQDQNSDMSETEEVIKRPPMPIFQFYPRDKPFLKQLIVRAALLEENEMMQVRGMLRKFDI